MVTRQYRCAICRYEWEAREAITAPLATVCPVSSCKAPAVQPVYGVPAFAMGRREDRYVNGGIALRREFVGREPDGRETVYRSLGDAHRGELDKASEQSWLPAWAQVKLARQNVTALRKYGGLLPGTQAAQVASAIEATTNDGRGAH